MKRIVDIICILTAITIFLLLSCSKHIPDKPQANDTSPSNPQNNSKKLKKVLFVDSYHRGYEWSDGIANGVLLTFGAEIDEDDNVDNSSSKVDLKIFRMDTKRNPDEEFKQAAAIKAKNIIDWWKPDVVIVADDHAIKYLLASYYKGAKLPFVFCGLNWDAAKYGLPCSNVAGMVEIADFRGLIDTLKKYSRGNRIGFMSGDRYSERAIGENCRKVLGIDYTKEYYVNSFDEFKDRFLSLQNDVDILILENYIGIEGWEPKEVESFILENVKIPIGTTQNFMMRYSLLGFSKIAEEQGTFAAKTALQILDGKSPEDIKVAYNEKTKMYLNMKMAKKLGITFPVDFIDQVKFFESDMNNED